ncbi:MAG: hypothetical protein V4506_06765 [Bacteroidota bacterium]
MKKLSEEEYKALSLKGKGRSSELFNSIINLKKGEAVLIEQKDWNRKAGPSTLVKYIEKTHNMKFVCAALTTEKSWVVKRIDDGKATGIAEPKLSSVKQTPAPVPVPEKKEDHLLLKSEITIFYLGRISRMKIERIEETLKAVQAHFIEENRALIKTLLMEIIELLDKQQHIVIENEKTYIPLKRN